jgi:hypothetical protein
LATEDKYTLLNSINEVFRFSHFLKGQKFCSYDNIRGFSKTKTEDICCAYTYSTEYSKKYLLIYSIT